MIEAAEVHVWRIPLDGPCPDDLADVLPAEERERAARFRFDRDRRRFLVSHSALRDILARYTLLEPARLRFESGTHGKPFLAGGGRIRFNLSHSGEMALCAVACGRDVGVDVEHLRTLPDFMAIATRFFLPEETLALRDLGDAQLQRAFFRTWTRKEAWLKGTGEGIAGLGQPCPDSWTITDLHLGPEYLGALAVEGPAEINVRDWS